MKNAEALPGHWTPLARCVLCGGGDFENLFAARDPHYGIPGSFGIARCRSCSLVCLNPMPDAATLMRLYPEDSYYSYQDCFQKPSGLKAWLAHLLLETGTKDPYFEAPGIMLDIGCGSGWFINEMRSKGWAVYGIGKGGGRVKIEINAGAAELGRSKAGLDIRPCTLLQASFPADHFDYIRSNHSFEHIPDPNETLAEARRILKPSGLLLIGVPNIAGWIPRLFGKYWYYLGAPVHTFNYSAETLCALLRKNGFHIERVVHNSKYHGVLGSIQILLNRGTGKASHEGWLINTRILRIISQALAKTMDIFRRGDCIEVWARKLSP